MFKKLQQYLVRKIEVQNQVTLQNKRIYILPTKQGLLFALTLFIMLLAAINFSNSLIYLITFFLASLAILSMLYTQKNLLGLNFTCGKANAVYCNETAYIPLNIFTDNASNDNSRHYAITIKTDNFSQTLDSDNYSDPIEIPVIPKQRGFIQLPTIVISSIYPFGLFYAWSNIRLSTQSIAYPKPLKHPLPTDLSSMQNSTEGSNSRGQSDFYGLDKYQEGESLKQIHWKAYAKGQGLNIKRFSGSDSNNYYWLEWEKFAPIETEKRLSILSHLITEAEKSGDSYGLRLPNKHITINRGKNHKHQCLEKLALF